MPDYRSIFVLSSNTSTNTIKPEAVPVLLRQAGLYLTEKDAKSIVNSIHNENITYEQFLEIAEEAQTKNIPYEKARDAFLAFDTENTGFISISLLKNLVSDTEELNELDIEEIISAVSKESDKFNYESFLKECYKQNL